MNVLYIIVPLALLLGGFFVGLFFYAVFQGQYDELTSHANRILINDITDELPNKRNENHEQND